MLLQTNTTYQISDSDSEYLTDSGAQVLLAADNYGDDQIWTTGASLSSTTLTSGTYFLFGEATDDGKVTCVTADSGSASKWSLTGDSDTVLIELLDSRGNLSGLYLVPKHDQRGAKVSKNKQTWKFNPKASTGSGGTS
jgi:hypothetical protein